MDGSAIFGSSFEGLGGFLLLAYFTSIFLFVFIAGFYLSYLFFIKAKLRFVLALLFSLLIGFFFGFISYFPILQIFSRLSSNSNYGMWWVYNAPPAIVIIEIVAVTLH